jgi:recombination protein RecT
MCFLAAALTHSMLRRMRMLCARATQSDLHLTQAIAAIRESFEELGILLAYRADQSMATAQDIALLDRSQPFAAQCAALGMKLAAEQVYVLAHWITDRDFAKAL